MKTIFESIALRGSECEPRFTDMLANKEHHNRLFFSFYWKDQNLKLDDLTLWEGKGGKQQYLGIVETFFEPHLIALFRSTFIGDTEIQSVDRLDGFPVRIAQVEYEPSKNEVTTKVTQVRSTKDQPKNENNEAAKDELLKRVQAAFNDVNFRHAVYELSSWRYATAISVTDFVRLEHQYILAKRLV